PDVASLAHALARATPNPSAVASAERVARVAAGTPAVVSARQGGPMAPPNAVTPVSDAGPTRTASAWGDTRREEKRGRRTVEIIVRQDDDGSEAPGSTARCRSVRRGDEEISTGCDAHLARLGHRREVVRAEAGGQLEKSEVGPA